MNVKVCLIALCFTVQATMANSIFIRMDELQTNHLKAYGIAYWALQQEQEVKWLVNYLGGSFLMEQNIALETECRVRGVSYEVISSSAVASLLVQLKDPDVNMDVIPLFKPAKIAVYSPKKVSTASFEDTDAVLLVLQYAEIPFELVYDEEVMWGKLPLYDWLHLHHEDFTGQFGKNLRRMDPQDIRIQEDIARRLGFNKVSGLKLGVANEIKKFCAGGGYLFAMCSGAESIDVALAAEGVDIVPPIWDGDGLDSEIDKKLDFSKTFAFGNFSVEDAMGNDEFGYRPSRSFSDINTGFGNAWGDEPSESYFQLFNFSAKWDIIPALLTQNHTNEIREFIGQTTAFNKNTVKSNALIMGSSPMNDRYIYGEIGKGQFAFYGGHDPEGRWGSHRIPTDLNLFPNSPGYRLILNNVLFPSANKKKRKT